jgi:hypothetical protein
MRDEGFGAVTTLWAIRLSRISTSPAPVTPPPSAKL